MPEAEGETAPIDSGATVTGERERTATRVRILLITAFITVLVGGLCAGGVVYALNENTLEGSGTIITEERPVAGVREIEAAGGYFRVVVSQGAEERLSVTSDDNIVAEITTEMDGEILEIGWDDDGIIGAWRVEPTDEVLVDVTVTDLQAIEISGSGDVEADQLTGDALAVEIAGSGDASLTNVAVDALTIDIDGSGDLDADGEVESQAIEIDGSGRVRADELASRTARVDVSGSGDVTVRAAETLDVEISGSGTVEYYGNPTITQDISGSGDLISLGGEADVEDEATPAATPRTASTPRATVADPGTPRAARQPTATPTPD